MSLLQLFNVPYFTEELRHYVVWGVLAGFIVVLAGLWIWAKLDGVIEKRELWITSIVWAVYCIIGISVIGNVSINRDLHEGRDAKEWVIQGP